MNGVDVRGIIHKQITFLWIVVNYLSSSYGSSSPSLGWRWNLSRWCCLFPSLLQHGSVIQSSARDVTGHFLPSLHKMSSTISLEVAMGFSCWTLYSGCFFPLALLCFFLAVALFLLSLPDSSRTLQKLQKKILRHSITYWLWPVTNSVTYFRYICQEELWCLT